MTHPFTCIPSSGGYVSHTFCIPFLFKDPSTIESDPSPNAFNNLVAIVTVLPKKDRAFECVWGVTPAISLIEYKGRRSTISREAANHLGDRIYDLSQNKLWEIDNKEVNQSAFYLGYNRSPEIHRIIQLGISSTKPKNYTAFEDETFFIESMGIEKYGDNRQEMHLPYFDNHTPAFLSCDTDVPLNAPVDTLVKSHYTEFMSMLLERCLRTGGHLKA